MYYNSIDVPSCASSIPPSADSIPANIPTFWYCQDCHKTFTVSKHEAMEHVENCAGEPKRSTMQQSGLLQN